MRGHRHQDQQHQRQRQFWCQARQGGPYAGIYIYDQLAPGTVALGNDVSVQGTYVEYYGLAELTDVTVTVNNAAGEILEPLVVDPANVADGDLDGEKYEGMFVKVENVKVTQENADADGDYDEFLITGGLRIDDFIWEDMDNTYPVDTEFSSITGILHYAYGNFKIVPRNAEDLVTP